MHERIRLSSRAANSDGQYGQVKSEVVPGFDRISQENQGISLTALRG